MSNPPPLPFEFHLTAQQVLEKLRGVKYLHRGTDLRGLDCMGHLYLFHKMLGLPVYIPDEGKHYPPDYWRNGVGYKYLNGLVEQFAWIPTRSGQFGDVVVFETKHGVGKICHTGILVDPDKGIFQHVVRNRKVDYASLHQRMWENRLAGVMRHRKMSLLTAHAAEMPHEVKR